MSSSPAPTGPDQQPAPPGLIRRLGGRAWRWVFGVAALIVGLSLLATFPIVQLLSLGYLLAASGRVARSGRLRDGILGVSTAARIGGVALGAWLLLWIPRTLSAMWSASLLIDPDSRATGTLNVALIIVTALLVVHVIAASLRGGRVRDFLIPRPRLELRALRDLLSRAGLTRARDTVWELVTAVRAPELAWLGLRGVIVGAAWLIIPTTLMALGQKAPLLGILGGVLMAIAVTYLPFIQARLAREDRLGVVFEVAVISRAFKHAPLAFAFALLVTVASALPLYLLKIELIPREAAWLPSILFVVLMFPARLLCGWALARGLTHDAPRHRASRIAGRVVMVPAVLVYALVLYFTQYLSWHGAASLYEQHAFLLPVPFLGG